LTLRQLLDRRNAIRQELRTIHDAAPDGALSAEAEARVATLTAEANTLNTREEQLVALADLDRRAAGTPIGQPAAVSTEIGMGLPPETRMAEWHRAATGDSAEGRSVGRLIGQHLAGQPYEQREMGSVLPSAGGITIGGPAVMNTLDAIRNRSAVVRAGALTVPLPAGGSRYPRVVSDPTPAWRAEGAAITESEGVFDSISLRAYSLAALVRVNNELLDDAPTFAATLDQQLAAALALELDRVALYGIGTSEPLGLRICPGVQEVSMAADGAEMDGWDKALDLMLEIEEANGTPTTAIMAPRTKIKLAKLMNVMADQMRPPEEWVNLRRLTSNQVRTNEVQGASSAASTLFMGDFSHMAFAIRQDIMIEASRVAGDAFSKNQTLVRATLRADVAIFRPAMFGRLVGVL